MTHHRDTEGTEIFKRINRDNRMNKDNKKTFDLIPVYLVIPVNFFLCASVSLW
jgi:hypothetical protein